MLTSFLCATDLSGQLWNSLRRQPLLTPPTLPFSRWLHPFSDMPYGCSVLNANTLCMSLLKEFLFCSSVMIIDQEISAVYKKNSQIKNSLLEKFYIMKY